MYLEQYLLSLYRKRFDEQISSLSTKERRLELASDIYKGTSALTGNGAIPDKERRLELASHINKGTSAVPGNSAISDKEITVVHSSHFISTSNSDGFQLKECNNRFEPETVLDSSIHRCHSALSQRTDCSIEASPVNIETKAMESYHSLPLFMLEVNIKNRREVVTSLYFICRSVISGFQILFDQQAQCVKSNSTSLADHFGNSYVEDVPETPNWLSEEMIKCISAIYCELTEPPFLGHKNASSPTIPFSSQIQGSKWGSQWKKHSFFNLNSSNPFHAKGQKEFSGPYCSMISIQQLYTDNQKLKEIEYMLRRFR